MAVNPVIMLRWATATRTQRWDEADKLWQLIVADWLEPPVLSQRYWNSLLDRRMAALERREQRRAIDDDEWDIRHEDWTR
jgi:hypothetical protein